MSKSVLIRMAKLTVPVLALFLMAPAPAFADDPVEGGAGHVHETDIWAMARGG